VKIVQQELFTKLEVDVTDIKKYYYEYEEFLEDTKKLIPSIKEYNPDTILAVARGGVTLGHFIASGLDNRRLFTVNSIHYDETKRLDSFDIFNIPDLKSASKVIIVDDIVDSGETMSEILKLLKGLYPSVEFKIATLFFKPTSIVEADFKVKEADCWIEFFWEVDI